MGRSKDGKPSGAVDIDQFLRNHCSDRVCRIRHDAYCTWLLLRPHGKSNARWCSAITSLTHID